VSVLPLMLSGDGCDCSLSGSEHSEEQRTPGSIPSNLQVLHYAVSFNFS